MDRELEISIDEWVTTDIPVATGLSAAIFDADRQPLTPDDARIGLRRLGRLRGRLISRLRRLRNTDLERVGPSDRNLMVVLDELARAHWWLLTRLGASPLADVPANVVARLDTAMALVVQGLTGLAPDSTARLVEFGDEEWTPRKVVRRLLWVEWTLGGMALTMLDAASEVRT